MNYSAKHSGLCYAGNNSLMITVLPLVLKIC